MKLKNAEFQIIDKDGNVVGTLITDENGKAISEPLAFGKYEIKRNKSTDRLHDLEGINSCRTYITFAKIESREQQERMGHSEYRRIWNKSHLLI